MNIPAEKIRAVLLALSVSVLVGLGLTFEHEAAHILHWIEYEVNHLGPWGPIFFALAYFVSTTLCLPGVPMVAAASTVFASQPLVAVAALSVGETLGQGLAFIIARRYAHDKVQALIEKQSWIVWLKAQVEQKGAKGVFVIRLMPFFPQNLGNYAFGLTSIPFTPYLVATFLGTLPLLVFYVGGFAGLVNILKHGLWEHHPFLLIGFVLLFVGAAFGLGKALKGKKSGGDMG